jgi:nucleotide-binding universal stress UspA family protein
MTNEVGFNRILVAVDGSPHGRRAAGVGARLARKLGAELALISVYPAPSSALGEPVYSERLEPAMAAARLALRDAQAEVAAVGGARAEEIQLGGHPGHVISQLARDGGYDLIVMGSRGLGRLVAAVLGSTSAEVSVTAHVPVLIVPPSRVETPIEA